MNLNMLHTEQDFTVRNPFHFSFKAIGHLWVSERYFSPFFPYDNLLIRYFHSSCGFNSRSGTNVFICMLILALWTCNCNFLGPKTHCGAYCSDIVSFYKADTPKGPYISFNQKNECLWLFPDVSTELPREHYLLMSAQLGCQLGNFLAVRRGLRNSLGHF